MSKKQSSPTEKKARNNFMIKPFYTTQELKQLIGYRTSKGTKAVLLQLKIPCNNIGKKDIWYLSDIQTYNPEFFSSLCEAANLQGIIKTTSDSVSDDEIYTSSQFKS